MLTSVDRSVRALALAAALLVMLRTAAVAQPVCMGDCDGNGHVTIGEILTMVNIALGDASAADCLAGVSQTEQISIDEILNAVNHALNGCGIPVSTATPTPEAPTPTPTNAPVTQTVLVGPNGTLTFSPADLTIHVGDTVEWVWSASHHSVVSGTNCTPDGQFCSPSDTSCDTAPVSLAGATYSHTFTAPGTYPYYCNPHCSFGMTGTITVE